MSKDSILRLWRIFWLLRKSLSNISKWASLFGHLCFASLHFWLLSVIVIASIILGIDITSHLKMLQAAKTITVEHRASILICVYLILKLTVPQHISISNCIQTLAEHCLHWRALHSRHCNCEWCILCLKCLLNLNPPCHPHSQKCLWLADEFTHPILYTN